MFYIMKLNNTLLPRPCNKEKKMLFIVGTTVVCHIAGIQNMVAIII